MDLRFFTHEITAYSLALLLSLSILGAVLLRLVIARTRRGTATFRGRRLRYVVGAAFAFAICAGAFSVAAYHPLLADLHLSRALKLSREPRSDHLAFAAEISKARDHLRSAEGFPGSGPFLALLGRRWGSLMDSVMRETVGVNVAAPCPRDLWPVEREVSTFVWPDQPDKRRSVAAAFAERAYFLSRCLADRGADQKAADFLTRVLLVDSRYRDRALKEEQMRRVLEVVQGGRE